MRKLFPQWEKGPIQLNLETSISEKKFLSDKIKRKEFFIPTKFTMDDTRQMDHL